MEIRRNCIPPTGNNTFQIFDNTILNKGKIMQVSIAHFKPGQPCPPHKHFDLHEAFVIEKGEIDMTVDDETVHLHAKDVCLVRPGHIHSLLNNSNELCEILVLGIAVPLDA